MFFDWLTLYQDFPGEIPMIGEFADLRFCTLTGDLLTTRQPPKKHDGSYCTSIQISISGNRITMSGNPSRYDRLDNLFGFCTLDDCVAVYNKILRSIDLGDFQFTKGTKLSHLQSPDGKSVSRCSDGAKITELHITSNKAVGQGFEDDYIKGLSTLRYRNSIPRLHTNGKTCDWLSKKGNAPLIYPSVYNKACEIELHHLDKLGRKHGKKSPEYKYLAGIVHYCASQGVVRYEQKLKSAFLRRSKLNFYGLFDEAKFIPIHNEFLEIDEKLQVEAMTIEGISERLLRLDICSNTKAANTTTLYAIQWMSGQKFDLQKSQTKIHRARLRQIGIDIADTCNISRHSPVFVRKAQQVNVSFLEQPDWYLAPDVNKPPVLNLVA